jgi:hypothetical protein
MWSAEISGAELLKASRWTVAFFNQGELRSTAGYPMRPIGEVAAERRGATDPQQLGEAPINYLGLENVRSQTGELVEFSPRPAVSVKSRSKIFKPGDVLFGRLRPELNKVYLAEGAVSEGLCSGEFIVLTTNETVILPRLLRHVLASSYVTQFASRLKVGASLPRMGTEDLLGIAIPVPPFAIQRRLVKKLEAMDKEVEATRKKLTDLPTTTASALMECLERGADDLKIV